MNRKFTKNKVQTNTFFTKQAKNSETQAHTSSSKEEQR